MDLPTRNPSVILQELPDGAVLYCTRTEVYFGLNEVGATLWNALPPTCASLDGLVASVSGRFPDAGPERIRGDALEFLADLQRLELVSTTEPQLQPA